MIGMILLLVSGMVGFLTGPVVGNLEETFGPDEDPIHRQDKALKVGAVAMNFTLLLAYGALATMMIAGQGAGGLGGGLGVLTGLGIFLNLELRMSYFHRSRAHVFHIMSRHTPNLLALLLKASHLLAPNNTELKELWTYLGQQHNGFQSRWFRQHVLQQGDREGLACLVRRGQQESWQALQQLAEQDADFARDTIFHARTDQPDWPRQHAQKFAEWMIRQPDQKIRKLGLRVAAQA